MILLSLSLYPRSGAICIDRRELSISLIPMFRLRANVQVMLPSFIITVGFGLEADIFTTALVGTLTFGLDTAGGFRVAFEMRLVTRPFGFRIFVSLSTFFVQFAPSA